MEKKKVNWSKYDKKYKRFTIKFNENDYSIVLKKAQDQQRTDEPNIATYVKMTALIKHVPAQKEVPEINKDMFLELKRIGVNINH